MWKSCSHVTKKSQDPNFRGFTNRSALISSRTHWNCDFNHLKRRKFLISHLIRFDGEISSSNVNEWWLANPLTIFALKSDPLVLSKLLTEQSVYILSNAYRRNNTFWSRYKIKKAIQMIPYSPRQRFLFPIRIAVQIIGTWFGIPMGYLDNPPPLVGNIFRHRRSQIQALDPGSDVIYSFFDFRTEKPGSQLFWWIVGQQLQYERV